MIEEYKKKLEELESRFEALKMDTDSRTTGEGIIKTIHESIIDLERAVENNKSSDIASCKMLLNCLLGGLETFIFEHRNKRI